MAIQLDYSLTRSFPGKWFGPLSVVGGFIGLVFLVVINTALVGYDTVVVFKDDYNARDSHWFDTFLPGRSTKQKCDAAFFSHGDSVRTNTSFFEWRVESIAKGNAATGISYKGETLAGCDLTSVFMDAILGTWTLDVTALVTCKIADEVEANIRTSFSISALPGRYESYLDNIRQASSSDRSPRFVALLAVGEAGNDIGTAAMSTFARNPATAPVVLSSQMHLPFCPANSDPNAACLQEPPKFSIEPATLVYANNTFVQALDDEASTALMSDYLPVWTNFAQTLYAAVKIDLGNNHANNFLLNPSVINNTLSPSFAPLDINSTLQLHSFLSDQMTAQALPVSSDFGPSYIQTTYLCRFERLKQRGSLFMAVLVATLSTFSAAWTAYLTAATMMLKSRGGQWNRCGGHEGYDRVPPQSPVPAPRFPMPHASGGSSDKLEYERPIIA